jgi:hypothetical protein
LNDNLYYSCEEQLSCSPWEPYRASAAVGAQHPQQLGIPMKAVLLALPALLPATTQGRDSQNATG